MRGEMAMTWPRTLTDAERSAILADQIERFAWEGWRPINRTETTVQLTRPKQFSPLVATLWFLLCGFGVLIYLFIYMSRRDPVARLFVTDQGKVRGDFGGGDD